MSVVLRCPTCGTTQAHSGECEACSEGDVRYFCTNHDEGVWLDGPVCGRCGARFGEPRTSTPPSASSVPRPTRPAGAPDFRPPRSARRPEGSSGAGFPRPSTTSREAEGSTAAEPDVVGPEPSLEDLLKELAGASARRGHGYDPTAGDSPWTRPGPPRLRLPFAGCLIRFVGMVLTLIVALILFLFLFFGGAFN